MKKLLILSALLFLACQKPTKISERNKIIKNDSISAVAPFRVVNIGSSNPINLLDFIKELEIILGKEAKKKFLIIGSAHSNKEIKIKENQKVEILFLSSLFKKNKNYLGINRFKLLSQSSAKKIIALGGISSVNLKKLKLLNCFGFAGISYFE